MSKMINSKRNKIKRNKNKMINSKRTKAKVTRARRSEQ